MAGAGGDALEWALALARAPAERVKLRKRRLPGGIEFLLQVAVGSPGDALASAVAQTGESQQYLVDASRFYLREVLFYPDADAYRVLGLERGANAEQLRAHHRWLQQWLHPDRRTSDEDAVFAGRVNAAWHQLRDEERRRVYDAEHPSTALPFERSAAPMAGWVHAEEIQPTPREHWRRAFPVMALVLACVALGVLALQDIARDKALVSATMGSSDVGADSRDRAVDKALDAFGKWPLSGRDATPAAAASTQAKEPPQRVPVPMPQPSGQRAGSPLAASTSPKRQHQTEPQEKDSITPPVREIASRAGESQIKVNDPPKAMPVPTQRLPSVGALEQQPVVAVSQTQAEPLPLAAVAAPPAKLPTLTPGSVRKAQQVGARLVAYLQSRNASVPPIWDTLAAQQMATGMRGQLAGIETTSMAEPVWQVGGDEACMSIQFRYPDGRLAQLSTAMVWREQRWLVSRLNLERDR